MVAADVLPGYLTAINGATSSITVKHLSSRSIEDIPLPLPPFQEQLAIVGELEKQFSRLDEAVANLRRAKLRLRVQRTSILDAAVMGRLSAETGRPAEGWTSTTIARVATSVDYGTSARATHEALGIAVLRMGNIVEGDLDVTDLKYLPASHNEFPRLLLEPGDLLFNRTNSPDLVGKCAVYRGSPSPCSFASYLIRIRFAPGCSPDFVAAYINSVHGRQWIKSVVTQQVGQANVNGSKLKGLVMPLPPEEEQRVIVSEVDRRLSIVREVEAQVDASLKRAGTLRQAILARAFDTAGGGEISA